MSVGRNGLPEGASTVNAEHPIMTAAEAVFCSANKAEALDRLDAIAEAMADRIVEEEEVSDYLEAREEREASGATISAAEGLAAAFIAKHLAL